MNNESILSQKAVEEILGTAKVIVEDSRSVCPMLFLHLSSGERLVTGLDLPPTTEERRQYLAWIGLRVRAEGKEVAEALLLSDGWFVPVKQLGEDLAVAPSVHPRRMEALVVIGRDAAKSRTTSVVQPYGRDANRKPVWQPLSVAAYNAVGESRVVPDSLLDYLFLTVKNTQPS